MAGRAIEVAKMTSRSRPPNASVAAGRDRAGPAGCSGSAVSGSRSAPASRRCGSRRSRDRSRSLQPGRSTSKGPVPRRTTSPVPGLASTTRWISGRPSRARGPLCARAVAYHDVTRVGRDPPGPRRCPPRIATERRWWLNPATAAASESQVDHRQACQSSWLLQLPIGFITMVNASL